MPQRSPSPHEESPAGAVAVILAAHGSRAESANDAHRTLAGALGTAAGRPVTPAFLELAEPSIGEAIDRAIETGAGRVIVLPYFLHPGRHLTEDLPRIVAEAETRHPGHPIRLLGAFGADPVLVKVLVDQVRAGLRPD